MKQAAQSDQDPLKYTVFPIQNAQHRQKLHKFITTRGKVKNKSSLCRFYLRGICIMKPQYCKFAHSVKQLQFDHQQQTFYWRLSEKQIKKRQFTDKKQFNQTALFILKNVKYYVLYEYQFTERFKKSNLPVHDIDTISNDRSVRIRIREIMHRENWDGFIDFLENRYPDTNYPISFISFWYANFGFDKPQTRCKFGDFLKYSMFVRKYIQVDIIFPPNTFPSIFLVNSNKKHTILQQNIDEIYEKCMQDKRTEGKQKMQQFLEKALPLQHAKKYMCRYFMAGNCQQTASQCLYAHSIEELDYQLGQQFPVEYRQPVMPIQVRMNFLSLYEATREYKEYQQYSQQDINLNTTIRGELRVKVHRKLFADFMVLLQNILTHGQVNKQKKQQEKKEEENKELNIFSIAVKDLQKYYQGAGFNHTNQNKFQHLQSALWDLGFYMQDVVIKDQVTLEKKKVTYAYKIPPMEYLNDKYKQIIQQCVDTELKNIGQDGVLLESALKRVVYSYPKKHILPLHVYLRSRNVSFQDVVQQICPQHQTQKIFFESSQQNLKKLAELIRKYVKKNKQYIVKIDQIQMHIREKKQQVNTNHFINLRVQIQSIILDIGKKIYYWPFDNNAYMIDPVHYNSYKKNVLDGKALQTDESAEEFQERLNKIQKIQETGKEEVNIECKEKVKQFRKQFYGQRVVVVDNWKALVYAEAYLEGSSKFGVDLQGKLRVGGYVDLIQISAVKKKNGEIQHKQIFVFDIFLMKKNMVQAQLQKQEQAKDAKQQQETISPSMLYNKTLQVLKNIFQNPKKLKILHDSRQDSQALHHILQIKPVTIFDTSGYDIYLAQKCLHSQKHSNSYQLLRKLYDVKVPGLNNILDTYKAPNGINIFKESMKKKFGEMGNRQYFQTRPIDDEFLEYSARDVEDLVQVWENMIQGNEEGLANFIGQLYCSG